jgi:hypothetical protein
MTTWKLLYRLPVYILVAGSMSACGAATGSFGNSGTAAAAASSTGTSTATTTTTTTSTSPALSYSGILVTGSEATATSEAYTSYSAACETTISGSGKVPTCANPSYISTTNLLEVQVTPAEGGLLAAPTGTYSGFSANYNCASYQVQVVNSSGQVLGSQQTGMLAISASAPCMDASGNAITTTSQILNFSSQISQSSHGPLDVQISAVNYDFYCKMLYDYLGEYATESEYYNLWCPSKAVYYSHTIGVSMEIEVNGTTF